MERLHSPPVLPVTANLFYLMERRILRSPSPGLDIPLGHQVSDFLASLPLWALASEKEDKEMSEQVQNNSKG